MRSSLSLHSLFTVLLFLTTHIAALSWPGFMPEIDALIVRRADTDSTSASETATSASATATKSDSDASATTESASATDTASATDSKSESGSESATATDSSTTNTKSKTSTDSDSDSSTSVTSYSGYAGGITLTEPPSTVTSYYKVGQNVTFGWNYTSLSVTPTALDIFASCTANGELYTLAVNQSAKSSAVTWDTGKYQSSATVPLLTETYTLIIFDAASSISATAAAGYLSVYDTHTFGMYTPQPYQNLSDWVCATCSGALGGMERSALGFAVWIGLLTVLSFTWFVDGLGLW